MHAQALIMEYCNLGGLHRYIDDRRFFRDPTPLPKGAVGQRAWHHHIDRWMDVGTTHRSPDE